MRKIPNGWHVSWLGFDDGAYMCQITRHDDDLDYISDMSFVSRRAMTQEDSFNAALDTIEKEYSK